MALHVWEILVNNTPFNENVYLNLPVLTALLCLAKMNYLTYNLTDQQNMTVMTMDQSHFLHILIY